MTNDCYYWETYLLFWALCVSELLTGLPGKVLHHVLTPNWDVTGVGMFRNCLPFTVTPPHNIYFFCNKYQALVSFNKIAELGEFEAVCLQNHLSFEPVGRYMKIGKEWIRTLNCTTVSAPALLSSRSDLLSNFEQTSKSTNLARCNLIFS